MIDIPLYFFWHVMIYALSGFCMVEFIFWPLIQEEDQYTSPEYKGRSHTKPKSRLTEAELLEAETVRRRHTDENQDGHQVVTSVRG